MKKSALLAVSALSLGVVGLATFTPVVSAVAQTTATGDATVTATVNSTLGIGTGDVNEGQSNTVDMHAYDITFGAVDAGEKATEVSRTITMQNNTGRDGNLTVKSSTDDTEGGFGVLRSGANTITSSATAPVAGTSTWGYYLDEASTTWKAVTETGESIHTDAGTGPSEQKITFGMSASNTQASGTYTGDITYTYTIEGTE